MTDEPGWIDAEDLETLYQMDDGDTFTSKLSGEKWTKIADQYLDSGRWRRNYLLVLQDAQERLWGLYYSQGSTEYQDHELPWRDDTGAMKLFPVVAKMTLTYSRFGEL